MTNNINNETVKRVTKAMYYTDIIALLKGEEPTNGTDTDAAIEFINKQMEQLAKKNSKNPEKTTAKQELDMQLSERIIEYLLIQTEEKTCTDIFRDVPELADYSTSKVASLVNKLMADGRVKKDVRKGRSVYSIA